LTTRTRSGLGILGRLLSGALGKAVEAAELPQSAAEWQKVLRLASAHLAVPQLRWALKEHGLFSHLPPDIAEFLEAVYALNLDRNRLCVEQLAHLTQVLNGIGVRPLLLKGAGALVSGLYPTLGERMVSDLDVLIPEPRLPEILQRLADEGYRLIEGGEESPRMMDFAGLFGHNHYPPIGSPHWPAGVELHVSPTLLASRLLCAEEMVEGARPLSWRQTELLLPSPTHFIVHNVIHAFVVDFKLKGWLSLRQSFEFVHAARIYGGRIDWTAAMRRFDERGYRSALGSYLTFAQANLGFRVPPGVSVQRWDRWTASRHLTLLAGAPSLLRSRAYSLHGSSRPLTKLRRLLTAEFYSRLSRDCMDILHHT